MSPPWMPLYVADYLADTGHLGAAEHGAYLMLIMQYWQKGGLPDDDRQLARIARMTDRAWSATKPILQPLFLDGWKHARIERELAKATEKTGRRSAAGEFAALQRWGAKSERKTRSQRLAEARSLGTHTDLEWETLQDLFGMCVQCGVPRKDVLGGSLCKDHIEPIYTGGSDAIENIQPMCRNCNSRKSITRADLRENRLPGWREMYAERIRLVCISDASSDAERLPSSSQPQSEDTSLRSVSAREPRKPKSVRTQISEDAQPTPADREHAERMGMAAEVFRFEWQRFRDHHLKVASTFASWPAAWRTWCANWLERGGGASHARAGPGVRPRGRTVAEMAQMDLGNFDDERADQCDEPPERPSGSDQGRSGFAGRLSVEDAAAARRGALVDH